VSETAVKSITSDHAPDGAITVREVANAVCDAARGSVRSPGQISCTLTLPLAFFRGEVVERVCVGGHPVVPAVIGELVRVYIHKDCVIPAAANLRRLVLEMIGERIEVSAQPG
jgi:hypothetical protein